MKIKLNTHHINRLFELTDLHMEWFNTYYTNTVPPYSNLLKRNHRILIDYCIIQLMCKYTSDDLNKKIDRMFDVCDTLFELTEIRRNNKQNNDFKELY